MLDSSVFNNAGKRIEKIEAGIQRQAGWNPVRDTQLPGLAQEAARLRQQLADARAAWLVAPERRNIRVVGIIFGACDIAFWSSVLAILALVVAVQHWVRS